MRGVALKRRADRERYHPWAQIPAGVRTELREEAQRLHARHAAACRALSVGHLSGISPRGIGEQLGAVSAHAIENELLNNYVSQLAAGRRGQEIPLLTVAELEPLGATEHILPGLKRLLREISWEQAITQRLKGWYGGYARACRARRVQARPLAEFLSAAHFLNEHDFRAGESILQQAERYLRVAEERRAAGNWDERYGYG